RQQAGQQSSLTSANIDEVAKTSHVVLLRDRRRRLDGDASHGPSKVPALIGMGREVIPRVRPERLARLWLAGHHRVEQAPERQPAAGSGERDRKVAKRPGVIADAKFSAQRRQLEPILCELGQETDGGGSSQQPAQPVWIGGGAARQLRDGARA